MTRRKVMFHLRSAALLFLIAAAPAVGYTGSTVAGGGSISGTVKAPGAKPLPAIAVTKDVAVCKTSHQPEAFVVGPDGTLRNVVVYLKDISAGKPLEKSVKGRLDQKSCTFVPHVATVPAGGTLALRSSDNVLHNVHAYMGPDTVFNLALPLPNFEISKTLSKPGIIKVKCDAGHTWMSAYIHVVEHPYYAVTDAAGKFELSDIPPGAYTLVAWHESLGTTEQKVTVAPGKAAAATFTFPAK